jgi:salicylate hydroxylase
MSTASPSQSTRSAASSKAAFATKGWNVIVIGAGIGGLTAALSLQRQGLKVSVYERASELSELGAGLLVSPNAMHALDFLGIGAKVADVSSISTGHQYRHYQTGDVLQRQPSSDAYKSRYGAGMLQVHRADLHHALSAAVLANDCGCIHLDHQCTSVSQDNRSVVARFANNTVVTGDALIGCDGGRSIVREEIHGPERVAFTGQVAFRALVPTAKLAKAVPSRCMYIGPGRLFLNYLLRHGVLMNIVAIARQPQWQEDGWTIPAQASELLCLYDDFHPTVLGLIKSIEPGSLFKWGLRDREPLQQWTRGRMSLLGDAAHPMSPFLRQGAAMAIEDGMVLGRCLAKARSPEQALELYENARKKRANAAQLQSRDRAKVLQSADVDHFDSACNADGRLFDDLFGYDPVTIPIEVQVDAFCEETPCRLHADNFYLRGLPPSLPLRESHRRKATRCDR